MMPPRLMPALVTPFDQSGEVDLEAHRHNLALLWGLGIRGFLIGGSTGEGPYLEPDERRGLVSAARETLGSRAFLLCGVAAETVRQARPLVEEAAEGGADGVVVMTPTSLVRNRHAYVEGFYAALADLAPVPVWLYTVPAVTGYELPVDVILRLAAHPNIGGIKDSGGQPVRIQAMAAGRPDEFRLYTGSTAAVSLALAAGADGAITASTNYLATEMLATVAAASSDRRSRQADVTRIAAAVEAHGIPGVKAAARAAGLRPGRPRLPLRPLPPSTARRLTALLPRG